MCTDTGIGLLTDEDLIKLDIPLTDSVEEVCRDYEGNYWFVSSRQGILRTEYRRREYWNTRYGKQKKTDICRLEAVLHSIPTALCWLQRKM